MTTAKQLHASFGGDAPRRAADEDQLPTNGATVSEAPVASMPEGSPSVSGPVEPSPNNGQPRHDRRDLLPRPAVLPPGVGYPGAPHRNGSGRGRLILPQKVVAKIASQAASEIGVVGGSSGGVLGIGAHADMNARPKVDVELSGRTATIDVDLAVAYPTPIRQATERARQHVMDRVEQLTGVTVTRVDVNVVSLRTAATPSTANREEGLR